jgi:hypothetical protein
MVARIVTVAMLTIPCALHADEQGVAVRATVVVVTEEKAGASIGSIDVVLPNGTLILLVTEKTTIERLTGKERRSATLGEVRKGDEIEVRHSGKILSSCPPQTQAYRVTILPRAK